MPEISPLAAITRNGKVIYHWKKLMVCECNPLLWEVLLAHVHNVCSTDVPSSQISGRCPLSKKQNLLLELPAV